MMVYEKTSLLQPKLRAAFLLAVALVAPSLHAGSKVLIVKSRAFPPFDQAAQEFRKCLEGKGASATYVEVVLPDDTRRRLCEALASLDAIAHPATGVRNIPL